MLAFFGLLFQGIVFLVFRGRRRPGLSKPPRGRGRWRDCLVETGELKGRVCAAQFGWTVRWLWVWMLPFLRCRRDLRIVLLPALDLQFVRHSVASAFIRGFLGLCSHSVCGMWLAHMHSIACCFRARIFHTDCRTSTTVCP